MKRLNEGQSTKFLVVNFGGECVSIAYNLVSYCIHDPWIHVVCLLFDSLSIVFFFSDCKSVELNGVRHWWHPFNVSNRKWFAIDWNCYPKKNVIYVELSPLNIITIFTLCHFSRSNPCNMISRVRLAHFNLAINEG